MAVQKNMNFSNFLTCLILLKRFGINLSSLCRFNLHLGPILVDLGFILAPFRSLDCKLPPFRTVRRVAEGRHWRLGAGGRPKAASMLLHYV
jgi:hypothetical protein